jgi:hypothetical protein
MRGRHWILLSRDRGASCCPVPADVSHGQADLGWLSLSGNALCSCRRPSASGFEPFRRGPLLVVGHAGPGTGPAWLIRREWWPSSEPVSARLVLAPSRDVAPHPGTSLRRAEEPAPGTLMPPRRSRGNVRSCRRLGGIWQDHPLGGQPCQYPAGGCRTQNSFPSGSARMCQLHPSSLTGSLVSGSAPRAMTRSTSELRSAVRRSR